MFLVMYGLPMFVPVNTENLTDIQKQEIYKNILANNSQMSEMSARQNTATAEMDASANNSSNGSQDIMVDKRILPVPGPGYVDNSGKLVRTSIVYTPGSQRCEAVYSPVFGMSDKYDSISYYDSKGYSVYHDVNYYGDIMFIYHSESTPAGTTSLEYKGGKYAIQTNYENITEDGVGNKVESSAPAMDTYAPVENGGSAASPAEPADIETQIKNYFGEDVDIIGTQTIDGKEYYVMQYSYETTCDYDYSIQNPDFWNGETYEESTRNQNDDKIVIRNYVNTVDYTIYKTENYLGKAELSNLIYSSVNTSSAEEGSYDEAVAAASFNVDVPVKKYSFDDQVVSYDFKKEAGKLVDYIQSKGYSLITLEELGGYELNAITSMGFYETQKNNDVYSELYSNRDFYPEGKLGDDLYENMYGNVVNDMLSALVDYNYAIKSAGEYTYYNLTASIFANSYDDMDIVNMYIYSPVMDKSIEDFEVMVNGVKVAAKLYKYQVKYDNYVIDPILYEGQENAVREKMIAPGGSGEAPSQPTVDSSYILIAEIEGGNKLVIRDTNSGQDTYPASLQKLESGNIVLKKIEDADKAGLIEQIAPGEAETLPAVRY